MKRFLALIVIIVLLTGCGSRGNPAATESGQAGTTEVITAETTSDASGEIADIQSRLEALESVVKVERIETTEENKADDPYKARYMVYFEQPVDWKIPDAGTFTQRVFVGFKSEDRYTCYTCGGYSLPDKMKGEDYFQTFAGGEQDKHFDTNSIYIEYRFYGDSVPKGLDVNEPKYWEFLTYENASKDFHRIISQLSTIFKGSTIFTGGSKGGYTTDCMAYYYPDDIDAYVSYVAPMCNGLIDSRFYDNIYNTIGDLTYGEEEASRYRSMVLELQRLLLEDAYREVIQPEFISKCKECGMSSLSTEDENYEVAVAEVAAYVWQYDQEFDKIRTILAIPADDFDTKVNAAKEYFLSEDMALYNRKDYEVAYYIQSYMEMGNYLHGLSWLRAAGANIKTPEENDATLWMRIFAPVLMEVSYEFDESFNKELTEYFKTTEKEIVMIEGLSDTWYAVRMPDVDNPNVHRYEAPSSHVSKIASLAPDEQKECWDIIEKLLKEE